MTIRMDQLVTQVLDPGWLSEQVGRPVRAARLRAKPQTSLVVGLDGPDGQPSGWVRFLWPISHDKAARTLREAGEVGLVTTERELGELLVQSGPLAADPKLVRRLDDAAVSGLLGQWEASQVLRYNPLRRLVIRDGMRVVRVAAEDGHGIGLDRFIEGVVDAPARLDDGTQAGISVQAFTGGANLEELPGPDQQRLSHAAGAQLARLHAAPVPADLAQSLDPCTDPVQQGLAHAAGVPDDLARSLALRAPDPVAQGLAHAALLDELAPGLAERMRRVVARFPGAASAIPVLSHGDLSPDQVLTTRDGGQVWLTDFDRACLAPRAVDLGSFLSVLDAGTLLDGYRDGGGQLPPRDQLRWAVAASLVLRAADPLRRASRDWKAGIAANLNQILEVVR